MDALDFLKYTLDPGRLVVLGAVAVRPSTLAELADATGQRERDVLAALAPLLQGGIVAQIDERYGLEHQALRALARDLPQPEPPSREVGFGMTSEEQAVLRRFFRGQRLVEIPSARGKRRIVLERIALDFEPGIRYAEAEVNERLTAYHDDYASLRRYLVDERFLDRDRGSYWRSGGRVE